MNETCHPASPRAIVRVMNPLRDQVNTMTAAEKIELIEAAWESLEADFPLLSKEQEQELDARWSCYMRDPENVIPWDRVKADLFRNR